MRILYAATGDIAVPLLGQLAAEGLVGAVLTAPDAPGRRGKSLVPSPVKVKALELGIPVMQPETLRTEARAEASSFSCDTLLSFCYGKIFGPRFLAMFGRKLNVHPSILPRYRGCSPIYAAIRAGDSETGITLQEIAEGVDEGDIYGCLPIALDGTETQESLEEKVRLRHAGKPPRSAAAGRRSFLFRIHRQGGWQDRFLSACRGDPCADPRMLSMAEGICHA